MSKVNRFPIEDKLLNQLAAIVGKEAAKKVARVCRSADFLASCTSAGEVADFLATAITDPKERKDVATKSWQWAKRLFGVYEDITPLTRDDAAIVVGEPFADAVMDAFDNWEQVLAFPSAEKVATLLVDGITDVERRNKIADQLYRYAARMFTAAQPRKEGGVSIGPGSNVNVGGDIVGRDKT